MLRLGTPSIRRRRTGWAGFVVLASCLSLAGCQNNPFRSGAQNPAGAPTTTGAAGAAVSGLHAQLEELRRRTTQLDAANRELHVRLAQVEQARKLAEEQVGLLRSQLQETAGRLKEVELARREAEKRVSAFQASLQQRGGATITPNNGLVRSLEPVDIPGLDVRQDGDLIRIAIPSDRLFRPGTATLLGSGSQLLGHVARAIAAHYPRQRVAIEVHTDQDPAAPSGSAPAHLLTAQQATVVLDNLTRQHRLPPVQLFIMAMGANHPKASNATAAGRAANRRVEIVIYPETFQ